MLSLVTHVIYKEEMPMMKTRKLARFNEFIKEFSTQRIQKICDEIDFWDGIDEREVCYSEMDQTEERLVQGNPRITVILGQNQQH